MDLTQQSLAHIVCPVCHSALLLHAPTHIDCTGCSRRYPIVDGLPVLIPARATPQSDPVHRT